MKASILQRASKLLLKFSNNSSMSELFRCMEVSPDGFRAISEWGSIEMWQENPDIKAPILVNTAAFCAVVNSLSPDTELLLDPTPEQLNWKAGSAKGHLAYPSIQQQIPLISSSKNFTWTPPKDFPDALELAVTACQSMTVSIGLYGILVENTNGNIRMTSSNNTSLATSKVSSVGYPTTETLTLRPPVPHILATLLRADSTAKLDVALDGIFVLGSTFVAQLPLSSALEHQLGPVIDKFTTENDVIKINPKAISTFLARAKALTDKSIPVEVTLSIGAGNLVLKQTGGAASSEEFFLAEGISAEKNFNSVVIPLALLLPSLEHSDRAVLDYLKDNILVLRGDAPTFTHIIGGKAK